MLARAKVILAQAYTPPSLRTNASAFTAQHTIRPLEHDPPAFSYPLSGALAVMEWLIVVKACTTENNENSVVVSLPPQRLRHGAAWVIGYDMDAKHNTEQPRPREICRQAFQSICGGLPEH
jgi:hypothetical protein